MASFRITTHNPALDSHGQINEPVTTSTRLSRARRHARKLRASGERAVMLFQVRPSGDIHPVSLNAIKYQGGRTNGCNSWAIEAPRTAR